MKTDAVFVDLSTAKTALFVRQTLASAFSIPLMQEFTWDLLTNQICEAARDSELKRISFRGLSQLQTSLPDEAKALTEFLRALQFRLPRLTVLVTLHD